MLLSKKRGKHSKKADDSEPSTLRTVIEMAVLFLGAVILATLIKTYLIQPFIVPTGSMLPTIQLKDCVLANKLHYVTGGETNPGDIVVVEDPTGEFPLLIKRVVAVGGQTIDFRDGRVYIDDKLIDEPYVHGLPTEHQVYTTPLTVPEGMVFIMGDNRVNSGDSRSFGPVDEELIQGKAFFTYWPLKNFGPLN